MLRTIGYEGSRVDLVLDPLIAAEIRLLIDVRALPLSRKPGFSKRQLAAALNERGIDYLHLRALGTPKPGRDAARAGRTDEMRGIFSLHMQSDSAQAQLSEAVAAARQRPCCLLCYEADHRGCHRDIVADLMCVALHGAVEHLAVEQGHEDRALEARRARQPPTGCDP